MWSSPVIVTNRFAKHGLCLNRPERIRSEYMNNVLILFTSDYCIQPLRISIVNCLIADLPTNRGSVPPLRGDESETERQSAA